MTAPIDVSSNLTNLPIKLDVGKRKSAYFGNKKSLVRIKSSRPNIYNAPMMEW